MQGDMGKVFWFVGDVDVVVGVKMCLQLFVYQIYFQFVGLGVGLVQFGVIFDIQLQLVIVLVGVDGNFVDVKML